MIKRKTIIFILLGAVVTPGAWLARHEEKILCPDSTQLQAPPTTPAQPKLLRVQDQDKVPDPDPTPCDLSNVPFYSSALRILAVVLWIGVAATVGSDYSRYRKKARRDRRRQRRRERQTQEQV